MGVRGKTTQFIVLLLNLNVEQFTQFASFCRSGKLLLVLASILDSESRGTLEHIIKPLLCNDRKIGLYSGAISGQRLSKHVPAATDTKATVVQQQRNGVFCAFVTQRRGKHISAATIHDTQQ
jgi:hypothetical protein